MKASPNCDHPETPCIIDFFFLTLQASVLALANRGWVAGRVGQDVYQDCGWLHAVSGRYHGQVPTTEDNNVTQLNASCPVSETR